ncbi:MAG: class I SAM-dependent methyltransferase [Chromatiales bacterium]|nr:class I SAM-dependent methyltransferase [Chromatiales bacterium]
MKRLVRSVRPLRRWLVRQTRRPRVGAVDLGDLNRLEPVSRDWGFDRGTPVDRLYIERFLGAHADDIQGRVLEVADNTYTKQFGGHRVDRSDVLHPVPGNPRATLVADLGTGEGVRDDLFDCIICTQTLQLIYRVETAIDSLSRLLKPSGVLLLTVPGISQICREDMEETGDYWRFTTASLERLLRPAFGDAIEIHTVGNVYSTTAFIQGLAAEELDVEALDHVDKQFQMLLTARAVKRA